MQFKDHKELLSIDEKGLQKELADTKKYLNAITFENSQGNLKDTSQLKKVKTYIAWIQTIRSSRKVEEMKTAA
ncbi:MAG: 50S ribosomal protein L29 [Candidatus Altimarinota bacterium]